MFRAVFRLYQRLPLIVASRVLFMKIFARVFDHHLVPSYAQFGEDRVVDNLLGEIRNGFYVDIGCNMPIGCSNTWKLYLRGWRGIAVDGNPALIEKFRSIRKFDIAVAEVISKDSSPVDFYLSRNSHLISGIGSQSVGHWQRSTENADIVNCIPVTLTELLNRYQAPHDFQFLSIDTEGNELDILEAMDFEKYHPYLIAIEIHSLDLHQPLSNPIAVLLIRQGYRLTAYVKPTAFFLSSIQSG